jgi:hypothetical protein
MQPATTQKQPGNNPKTTPKQPGNNPEAKQELAVRWLKAQGAVVELNCSSLSESSTAHHWVFCASTLLPEDLLEAATPCENGYVPYAAGTMGMPLRLVPAWQLLMR